MKAESALSPFASPVFRRVWLANLASNFGGLIQSVAAAWLMLTLTGEADMVALVQTSTALPMMLLSLMAGAVADSFDRRRVMLAAQLFMLAVSVALAAIALLGALTPWLLLGFTFLIGCGAAFNAPAWQASVRDMVPPAQLPAAVAMNSMGFNIARSTGPAIGGAIVAATGAATAFAVNAFSYIGLLFVLWRWQPPREQRPLPPERLASAMAAGVRYVRLSPSIRTVLLRCIAFGFGAGAVLALLPLVAARLVGGGALSYGLLLGAFGVGAVVAAIGSPALRNRFGTETIVRLGTLALAVAALAAGLATALWSTMLAMLLAGAAWLQVLSTFNVAVQLAAPRWVVARTLALYQMAAFGGIASGSALWGIVAERHGTGTALSAAAVTLFASALLGWLRPLDQADARDLDPLRQHHEPRTAVPVQPRTGPVVVSVEYLIDEGDVPEFLSAMVERRRIRRRDGAQQWVLLRDLHDARVWVERYKAANWHDYLRLAARPTRQDAEVPERLRALHRGTAPPHVRRMIERSPHRLPDAAHARTDVEVDSDQLRGL